MKRYIKLTLIITILMFSIIGLIVFSFNLLFDTFLNPCGNEEIKSIVSPDNKYVAKLFIRDCGATTKKSYQLSILPKGKKIGNSEAGNIFVSYDPFKVQWEAENELLVIYRSELFKKETKYRELFINYKIGFE